MRDGRKSETNRYVGTPSMNAVCKQLVAELDVRLRHEIVSLENSRGAWHLLDKAGQRNGEFDTVIVSSPSNQTAKLLAPVPRNSQALASGVKMQPCWAFMVAFGVGDSCALDGAFVHDSPLSWIARNSINLGRPHVQDCWVLHGSADWSRHSY